MQNPVSTGAFSEAGFEGILGSDVLRQFEVTFDLGHALLYLKPDTGFRPDPYKYVTIEIQFAKDTSGAFTVVSVEELASSGCRNRGRRPDSCARRPERQRSHAGAVLQETSYQGGNSYQIEVEHQKTSSVVTVRTRKLLW